MCESYQNCGNFNLENDSSDPVDIRLFIGHDIVGKINWYPREIPMHIQLITSTWLPWPGTPTKARTRAWTIKKLCGLFLSIYSLKNSCAAFCETTDRNQWINCNQQRVKLNFSNEHIEHGACTLLRVVSHRSNRLLFFSLMRDGYVLGVWFESLYTIVSGTMRYLKKIVHTKLFIVQERRNLVSLFRSYV